MREVERNITIVELLKEGKTLDEVGKQYGLTRERIRQIKNKIAPGLDKEEWGRSKQVRDWLIEKKQHIVERYNRENFRCSSDLEREMSAYFTRKKQNAKGGKWEFTVEKRDIVWNTVCPILGMELDWSGDCRKENSPSLDRIDPKKGYIPGNVQIISWRANRIKNDGTAEEHMKIAEYMNSYK